jgi:hypothetical protein
MTKRSVESTQMTEMHAVERYDKLCGGTQHSRLQVKPGRKCFQGNLADILHGRKTTGIKANNTGRLY